MNKRKEIQNDSKDIEICYILCESNKKERQIAFVYGKIKICCIKLNREKNNNCVWLKIKIKHDLSNSDLRFMSKKFTF